MLTAGGTSAYPSVSQKILKEVAARIFVYWLSMILVARENVTVQDACLGPSVICFFKKSKRIEISNLKSSVPGCHAFLQAKTQRLLGAGSDLHCLC